MRTFLLVSFWIISASSLAAETWVNSLFSDGMVLQREAPIKIWGSDTPNQSISITFREQTLKATADAKGDWSLFLSAEAAGGPSVLSIKGSSTKTINDVYVGEVWLCSGQSNMAFPLAWLKDNPNNPQSANLPTLRLFKVAQDSGGDKSKNVSGKWQIANGSVADWSATAFHFGNHLQQHLNVPVGLINSSVGGTPIESWTDHLVLDNLPDLQNHVNWINGQVKKYPEMKKQLDALTAEWTAKGKKGPAPTVPNMFAPDSPWRPAGLFNRMIAPIIGYTIKGCIWYQGESNANSYKLYGNTLKAMIGDWRKQWEIGDFPFLTVQLANFQDAAKKPYESKWAGLREAQNDSLALANTGVAVIIDIGEAKDIHPKNKKDVGYRLSLQARKIAYAEDLIYSGPFFKQATVEGKTIRISFDHTANGLKIKGDHLTAFEIAAADKKFVWAKARIDGTEVVVSADEIEAPQFVRYGWAENPACNLYNSADLPASPFRSDR